MATQRTVVTAAKAASTLPQVASNAPSSWIQNMPTRAIADVLLQKQNFITPHDALYEEVNQTGIFRSHRHFKHCLKMMKDQKRVKVICLGPEKVTSRNLKFSVKLTKRGQAVYTYYQGLHRQSEDSRPEGDGPGLKDALP